MKKTSSIILSILLVIALVFTGCTGNNSKGTQKFKSQITLNGSSTIAPIVSKVSTSFIEKNVTWDKVNQSFPKENISIYVSSGGSSAGVKSVIENTSDLGLVSRTVKDEEKNKIEGYQEFKIGIDALTISVNSENPIVKIKGDLTKEELIKIFSGEFKFWDEIDASLPHREIVVVIRDIGGGAHEVFQKSIMGETNVRQDAIQAPSMGALATKIIENKDAIGYASVGMWNQHKDKITALKVDGIEPSVENIVNSSYKIQRPLLIIKKGELTPQEKAFIDIMLSEEGLKAVEDCGYVPVK